jgi:hypothetical protein
MLGIGLWTSIHKSHLTHIYSEDDEMSEVSIYHQALRYYNLRQGDKKLILDFKISFNNKVKSNQGVGMPEISEKLLAMIPPARKSVQGQRLESRMSGRGRPPWVKVGLTQGADPRSARKSDCRDGLSWLTHHPRTNDADP